MQSVFELINGTGLFKPSHSSYENRYLSFIGSSRSLPFLIASIINARLYCMSRAKKCTKYSKMDKWAKEVCRRRVERWGKAIILSLHLLLFEELLCRKAAVVVAQFETFHPILLSQEKITADTSSKWQNVWQEASWPHDSEVTQWLMGKQVTSETIVCLSWESTKWSRWSSRVVELCAIVVITSK